MKEKLGLVLSAKFGLIVIVFLMPFINVSCRGMVNMNIPLSGMDLATGTTIEIKEPFSGKIEKQKVDAEPYAAIALGAAVLGLLVGFAKVKPARIVNAISGGAGAVFLLLLKSKIDKEIMKEGGGMISVAYEAGFWIALILFVLAVAISIYTVSASSEAKLE